MEIQKPQIQFYYQQRYVSGHKQDNSDDKPDFTKRT